MSIEDRFLVPEARQFLESYRVKDIKEGTIKARERHLELFSTWLNETDRNVTECDFEDIEAYIGFLKRDQGYAHKTAKGYVSGASILFERLMKKGAIEQNPVSKLDLTEYLSYNESHQAKILKDEHDVIWLSKSEIKLLTKNVNPPRLRNRLIIQFLYQTGVRRQEACDVELDDLRREERAIKIRGKGEKNRTVYYDRNLDVLLDSWIDKGYRSSSPFAAESGYLFLSHEAAKLHGNTVNQIIKQAAENAGIQTTIYRDSIGRKKQRVTTHSVRHSFAVEYLRQNGNIERLRELMGHASVETTEKYAKVIDDDVREERSGMSIGNTFGPEISDDQCEVCGANSNLSAHHTSYDPPVTIDVCTVCHAEIHHSNKHEHLLPDMSLAEAKDQGYLD